MNNQPTELVNHFDLPEIPPYGLDLQTPHLLARYGQEPQPAKVPDFLIGERWPLSYEQSKENYRGWHLYAPAFPQPITFCDWDFDDDYGNLPFFLTHNLERILRDPSKTFGQKTEAARSAYLNEPKPALISDTAFADWDDFYETAWRNASALDRAIAELPRRLDRNYQPIVTVTRPEDSLTFTPTALLGHLPDVVSCRCKTQRFNASELERYGNYCTCDTSCDECKCKPDWEASLTQPDIIGPRLWVAINRIFACLMQDEHPLAPNFVKASPSQFQFASTEDVDKFLEIIRLASALVVEGWKDATPGARDEEYEYDPNDTETPAHNQFYEGQFTPLDQLIVSGKLPKSDDPFWSQPMQAAMLNQAPAIAIDFSELTPLKTTDRGIRLTTPITALSCQQIGYGGTVDSDTEPIRQAQALAEDRYNLELKRLARQERKATARFLDENSDYAATNAARDAAIQAVKEQEANHDRWVAAETESALVEEIALIAA